MECLQGKLKSSFQADMEFKITNHQPFLDENEINGENGIPAAADDIFVEELFDFSNGFFETEEKQPEQQVDEPQETAAATATNCGALVVEDDVFAAPFSEPSIPAEDLDSLEWLSHFVDDSFSDHSAADLPAKPCSGMETVPQNDSNFTSNVQTKARTKRTRTGVRVWPLVCSSLTESSSCASSSSSSSNSWLVYAAERSPSQTAESLMGKSTSKKHRSDSVSGRRSGGAAPQQRKCSHCGVTRTPQWRAGPLGPKSLCNACGVRYKSGRLLPEYRPASSPTFSMELHSNNHRKVLEMRRMKESETGLAHQESWS